MATNHTQNYQLNLWEPQDRFLRTEFNENSVKLDAALKAEADARAALAQTVNTKATTAALNALTQTVNAKADTSAVNAALAKKADQTALDSLSQTVGTKADQTALTALQTTVAQHTTSLAGQLKMVAGTYTGTGTYGENNKKSLSFSSTLGTSPKLLIVAGTSFVLIIMQGMDSAYITGSSCKQIAVAWSGATVSWYSIGSAEYQMNFNGATYRYVAFA